MSNRFTCLQPIQKNYLAFVNSISMKLIVLFSLLALLFSSCNKKEEIKDWTCTCTVTLYDSYYGITQTTQSSSVITDTEENAVTECNSNDASVSTGSVSVNTDCEID